jgi:hypothetical protein
MDVSADRGAAVWSDIAKPAGAFGPPHIDRHCVGTYFHLIPIEKAEARPIRRTIDKSPYCTAA